MRVYLDFALDESYTPTRMTFWGGTGMHDLVCASFSVMCQGGFWAGC